MNTAEKLRQTLVSKVDKTKVLNTVVNGIAKQGYCLMYEPYDPPSKTKYGDCNIKIATLEDEVAIKELCLQEGFKVRNAYHPVSGRLYGYEIRL